MRGSTALRHRYVLGALGAFCQDQGLGAAPLGHGLVEAFVALGLPGRAPSTQGTYRSVLRRDLAGKPPWAGRFPPSPAARPYSSQEIAELFSLASSQRSHWRRSSALSFLALGIGAGLRPGELAAVRGDDISSEHEPVVVRVAAKRLVPVVGSYAIALVEQASEAGAGYLFCPGRADRAYKNFVNNFCYGLAASPSVPRFSSGRARSTFICAHLATGTPLPQLLYMAGICEVESLLRYCRHVPGAPRSKAELRARLRSG
jgi:integrase